MEALRTVVRLAAPGMSVLFFCALHVGPALEGPLPSMGARGRQPLAWGVFLLTLLIWLAPLGRSGDIGFGLYVAVSE